MSVKSRGKARFFRSYERIMQGGKRKEAASGESSAKYFDGYFYGVCRRLPTCFPTLHISIFSYLLFLIGRASNIGKWGPFPNKEANRGIPPLTLLPLFALIDRLT